MLVSFLAPIFGGNMVEPTPDECLAEALKYEEQAKYETAIHLKQHCLRERDWWLNLGALKEKENA
jgi:hypothetical protein